MTLFELEAIGGPWAKRLARRRASIDALPWDELAIDAERAHKADRACESERRASHDRSVLDAAREVWTQSAFSEYASAASFAEIASALLAAGAPIDLVAAAGSFVVDEIIHAELSGRIAMGLGGAVPLEVDLEKLVRPPTGASPLLRAAELLVRTSCVGETLTIPLLKVSRDTAGSTLITRALTSILRDESQHAQIGWWFLDWAAPRWTAEDRAHLADIATRTMESFSPVFSRECSAAQLGVLDCSLYDEAFFGAVEKRIARPLRERGIVVGTVPRRSSRATSMEAP